MKRVFSKLFSPSMVFVAAMVCVSSGARAQEAPMPVSPDHNLSGAVGAPPGPMQTLACCRCLGETTTLNLGTGIANWALENGPAFPVANAYPGWTTALSPAKWIQSAPSTNGSATGVSAGTYKYQLRFMVPRCLIGATVQLAGRFAADNSARLLLNGTPIAATPQNKGFVTPTSFSAVLPPGIHTLMIEVKNEDSVSGAVLQAQLVRRCATEGTSLPAPPIPPMQKE